MILLRFWPRNDFERKSIVNMRSIRRKKERERERARKNEQAEKHVTIKILIAGSHFVLAHTSIPLRIYVCMIECETALKQKSLRKTKTSSSGAVFIYAIIDCNQFIMFVFHFDAGIIRCFFPLFILPLKEKDRLHVNSP